MTISADDLVERLSGLRQPVVAALLEAQANALNRGAEIDPEPIQRDASGVIVRSGPLNLPQRGDLATSRDGRTLIHRVETPPGPAFEPFPAYDGPDFSAQIQPFAWDNAVLDMKTNQSQPAWTALRHWFLEWFQARPTELSPELSGAVHSLQGPWRAPGRWRAVVDLGSAPTTCVPGLIAAVSQSGCASIRIGAD